MIKYYVRTTGERVLHNSFKQIDFELLLDNNHELTKIFPSQLLSIADSDVVLLEDDIILCNNFKEEIEKAINQHPYDIINFFENPMVYIDPNTKQLDFAWNQCTYIPKEKIIPLANKIIELSNREISPARWTPETMMKQALKLLQWDHYIYRPCLVQHIDFSSILQAQPKPFRRTIYYIDYLKQLDIPYEDANNIKNKSQLNDLLDQHIESLKTSKEWFSLNKNTCLIIGYGVVGHNLHKEYNKLFIDIYDKYKTQNNTKKSIKYKFAFICVDTPYIDENNPCDISQVEAALQENDAEIYIIKSTILPGTTEMLKQKYNKRIIFSPEYYGGTQHCNNFKFDFTILGGEKEDCREVIQLLQDVYDARHTFRMTDSKTAELVKYMENSYLGMKVAFCCQFYDIAEKLGISYEELRELFILDERVNPSHTFVYKDHPYFSSHCLDKDIPAIANFADAELLKDILKFNEKRK